MEKVRESSKEKQSLSLRHLKTNSWILGLVLGSGISGANFRDSASNKIENFCSLKKCAKKRVMSLE